MAQQIKALPSKPDSERSIPRTYTGELVPFTLFSAFHVHTKAAPLSRKTLAMSQAAMCNAYSKCFVSDKLISYSIRRHTWR